MAEIESRAAQDGARDRRKLVVLGSTGSIGRNTLDVIRHMGGRERFEVLAVTGMGNTELLAAQAVEAGARLAVTADPPRYGELKERLAGTSVEAAAGPTPLCEAASMGADWVMAGIVGVAGLQPTLAAARTGAVIALANKECLVSAGRLFMAEVERAGGTLLPVDSEHNAIFQVLDRTQPEAVERIILTASGGPFRDWSLDKMRDVTPAQAAAHPNWSMGQKISIDSASLFNKALEMIEADLLFGAPGRSLEVVIHPQSVIHSMVGYRDGSVLAQLGSPDMRTAIGYALGWPERPDLPVERLDFSRVSRLDFSPPDEARFPALRLAREAIHHGGLAGAVLNGAKEAALEAFIAGSMNFLQIAEAVEAAMAKLLPSLPREFGLDDVFEADGRARRAVAAQLERRL
ncbi:MAG TPA: 1-deoxy-D-xylulose-5-phosphate reductoisomerase [Mesorhizobium sp.]|jgi:1-deoxy-D-xylulose-5-phosphate reductoisomerase|nr:1-deoxy-D-xylulose-5-phosphate reductoisomerase [Mesorhizobium sp.]